jgi:hypothetical protein
MRVLSFSTVAFDLGSSTPLECCAESGKARWTAQTIAGMTGILSPLLGLRADNGNELGVLPRHFACPPVA